MPIKTIEVICRPCHKCENVIEKIQFAMKVIETENKAKIPYEFKHTTKVVAVNKYALSPAQTPIVLVNGNVEFAGRIETCFIKPKLTALQKDL